MPRIGGHRWRTLVAQVLMEENGICHLCGKPGATTGDHLIPFSKRPDLELERNNIRAAHLKCNQARGDRPIPAKNEIKTSRTWLY